MAPAEAARFAGERYAPGWRAGGVAGALAAAREAALTIASAGAEVRRVAGDAARAEATVAGWPAAEVAAFFGLEPAEADAFYEVFGPIAAGLGLRYGWRREGDAVTLAFDQDDAG